MRLDGSGAARRARVRARRTMLLAAAALLLALWPARPARAETGLLPTPLSGWLWSAPTPQGNGLDDVAFIGEDGYAVGGHGVVLRSSDGGQSWEAVRFECSEEGTPRIQELTPQTLIVDDCGLWESSNGGASFTAMNLAVTPGNGVESFSFLSPGSGFVETWSGSVMWTEDGGASFEARTPPPLEGGNPGPIRFVSPNTGVAIVNGKVTTTILRTEDGARSWHEVAEVGPELRAMTFLSPSLGYAVGEKGTMLRTEDGGRTWSQMPLTLPTVPPPPNLETIACGEPNTCLMTATSAAFNELSVIRTADGGLTGTAVEVLPAGLSRRIEAIAFTSPTNAVGVGSEGMIARSSDAGATFTAQASPFNELQNVFQQSRIRLGSSPQEAYVAGENGWIAATNDGGRQWRLLTRLAHENLVDVAFPTAQDGFALGNDGSVYRTDDGGRAWHSCGHQAQTAGSLLAPSTRIVLVTERNGIWRSTNGCARFLHVRQAISVHGHTHHISAFNFADTWAASAERLGDTLIVPGEQLLLESTDDGQRWRVIPQPAEGTLTSVSFLGPRVGYEMLDGVVYFTRDAGRHWREIRSLPYYESAEPSFISFSNVRDGFAVARYPNQESNDMSDDTIFRTEDAGATWIPEVMPTAMGGVTATNGISYAAAETDSAIYVTHGSGLAGSPSRLRLSIDGPTTRPADYGGGVLLEGQLTPALAGTIIHLSWWSEGAWESQELKTDAHGAFSLAVAEPDASTWFVADWNGNATYRGAATEAIGLTVRPRR